MICEKYECLYIGWISLHLQINAILNRFYITACVFNIYLQSGKKNFDEFKSQYLLICPQRNTAGHGRGCRINISHTTWLKPSRSMKCNIQPSPWSNAIHFPHLKLYHPHCMYPHLLVSQIQWAIALSSHAGIIVDHNCWCPCESQGSIWNDKPSERSSCWHFGRITMKTLSRLHKKYTISTILVWNIPQNILYSICFWERSTTAALDGQSSRLVCTALDPYLPHERHGVPLLCDAFSHWLGPFLESSLHGYIFC